MSQESRVKFNFGSITTSNNLALEKSHVTQITSITTAVTATTQVGTITTVSATTAANSASQFTVNHADVTSSSLVFANIMNYAGSAGLPSLYIDNTTTGSFVVTIQNHHDTNALNGVLKISYLIL